METRSAKVIDKMTNGKAEEDFKKSETNPITAKASNKADDKKKTKLIKKTKEEPKTEKKQSATDFLMKYLLDHPKASEEDAQKALMKAGFRRLAETTVYYWHRDMASVMSYLKETGKLK